MPLTAITSAEYGVDLDIVYATPANITGRPLYRRADCYLNAEAAALLRQAVALAGAIGLRLRVFDGFRPVEAQRALWQACPDPAYISNPATGSAPHCRGAAVDLTLCDATGAPLDMGTGFDDLSPRSRHGNTEISAAAQRSRMLLLGVMTAAGWDFYRNEWWHYQLFRPRRFPLLSDSVLATPLVA